MTRRDFAIDPVAVRAAARRRLLLRVSVMLVLGALFGVAVDLWVPESARRLAWSFAVAIFAVYAAVEVSSLQWAKRSAPTMVLRLTADALELWIGTTRHRMPYADLRLVRVRHGDDGKVRSLQLDSRNAGRVEIAGFHDMDELAEALTAAIAAVRADR